MGGLISGRLLRRVLLEPVVSHIALVPVPEGLRSDGPVHQTVLVWSTVEDFTVLITTSFVEHQLAILAFRDTDVLLGKEFLEIIEIAALFAGVEHLVAYTLGVVIGIVYAVIICLLGKIRCARLLFDYSCLDLIGFTDAFDNEVLAGCLSDHSVSSS